MADYPNFIEMDSTPIIASQSGTSYLYRNAVYDTVLGGGGWQYWYTSDPDGAGSGYAAQTGGATGNWKAGSYYYDVMALS